MKPKPSKPKGYPPARSHADRTFDALFVPADPNAPPEDLECYLCGKTTGEGCRCWVLLRCADCRDSITVRRIPAEDGDDDEVVTLCPACAPIPAPDSTPRAT